MSKGLLEEAENIRATLVEYRRYLHEHAEVGFDLEKTVAFVTARLEESGYRPQRLGKACVIATVGKRTERKAFLLRADMDALPIKEKTGERFACKKGNMHACGHDMHTAMLLGAARLLKKYESRLQGEVRLLFQPAEELLAGAKAAIEAGALDGVDGAMMLHVMTDVPLKTGTVVVAAGVSAPAADYFRIEVTGKGCHGSAPQNGVDALTAAAHILVALQEISARELSVNSPATITVGTLQAGEAGNAIADKAVMRGTLRAFDEDTRAYIKSRIQAIVTRIAAAFRAKAKTVFEGGCPSLINDETLGAFVTENTRALLGKESVFSSAQLAGGETAQRNGGSEDFAYISRRTPSVMLALAAGNSDEGYAYPLHHPKTRFDERALSVGAAVLAYNALKRQGNMPVSSYDKKRRSEKVETPRVRKTAYAADRI